METAHSILPVLAVLVPLFFAALVTGVQKWAPKYREILVGLGVGLTLLIVALMTRSINGGLLLEAEFLTAMDPFTIHFHVDSLGFLMALVSASVWLLASFYSMAYLKYEHVAGRYYPCLFITLAGALGVMLAGNLYTLFIFFELMAFTAYVFVTYHETPEAFRAGTKYMIVTILSGLLIFLGIIITYWLAESISLTQLGIMPEANSMALVGFFAFIIGFGFKAGIFPLHIWLPAAHPVAPSPASALLSGIMIKTGAFGIIRVIYNVYGAELMAQTNWMTALLVIAGVTMLYGSALAVIQDDIKRRLAYSSIGQIGYILLGAALLTERGLIGDIFHIVSHAAMKSTLFLAAGAIIVQTGKKKVSQFAGIGKQMPLTMAAFTLAALAMIGIPPLNGFISKWELALGSLEAGQPIFAGLLLISSMLNAAYYLPVIISAYFRSPQGEKAPRLGEVPLLMLIPMLILAISLFIFELTPINYPLVMSIRSAQSLLGL